MMRDRWIALLLGLFGSILFVQSIGFDFAMDDNGLIKANPLVKSPARFTEIFYTDYWYPRQNSGLYRPLPKATYALNHAIDGLDPRGYHAVNVVLHGVMTALVFLLLLRMTRDRRMALVAGLVFAAHAVHTEVVANTTFGRPETMAGIFSVLAMLGYLAARDEESSRRRRLVYGASLVAFFLALLCKESSVTIIGVLALYDFCYRRSEPGFFSRAWQTLRERFVPGYLGFCVVVGIYMGLRAYALAGKKITPPHITLDNPILGLDLPWRVFNALYVAIYHYTWKLVFPRVLSHDYSYDAIPMIREWSDPRLWLTFLACLGLVALLVWAWRRAITLFFALSSYLTTFSVVSNVVVLIGTILGERLLYFPSIFFSLAAAWAIVRLGERIAAATPASRRAAVVALTLVVVGAHVGRSLDRLQDWKDEYTLFTHDALEVVPRSAKALNNAGALAIKHKRYEEGLELLDRAIEVNPLGYPTPYYTAALALTTLGRNEEAAQMYEKSLLNGDRDPFTRNNLGFILVDHEMDVDRGVALIEEAVSAMPQAAEFRDSLAWGYFKQGRFEEALEEINRAIALREAQGKPPSPEHLEHKRRIVEGLELRRETLGRNATRAGASRTD